MARGGTVSDATMTRMQELGSAWVFKRAIQDNVVFNSANAVSYTHLRAHETN